MCISINILKTTPTFQPPAVPDLVMGIAFLFSLKRKSGVVVVSHQSPVLVPTSNTLNGEHLSALYMLQSSKKITNKRIASDKIE